MKNVKAAISRQWHNKWCDNNTTHATQFNQLNYHWDVLCVVHIDTSHNKWYMVLSKSSWNLNFVSEWLWVPQYTDRCLPTHPSWISVASNLELSGWVYCSWMYFHCCVSVSLWFCNGWPERAVCLCNVLFETWEDRCRNLRLVEEFQKWLNIDWWWRPFGMAINWHHSRKCHKN
jgi:hypothetical protein